MKLNRLERDPTVYDDMRKEPDGHREAFALGQEDERVYAM